MENILSYRLELDDQAVEYDILAPGQVNPTEGKLADIEARIAENEALIESVNKDIDKWTAHTDKIDNLVAVASGVVAGLIDSFFVGEFDLRGGTQWGQEKVESFVKKTAKKQGYNGDSLSGAIKSLEDKYPIPADSATDIFGGGKQHHLRDFSHHPTPVGLLFSMMTQFTGMVYGTNTAGVFIVEPVPDKSLIGVDLPRKIAIGTVNWFFHMVSDVAGSSGSVAMGSIGTGLPGPIVSLLKELSCLPIFKKVNAAGNKQFSVWISKLFNGTLLADRDETGKIIKGGELRFDLRAEMGVLHELGRQAIPILINEAVVRIFYFVRRLCIEFKDIEIHSLKDFIHKPDWKKILPFNNRTITRMLTISTGTFVAVDLADASIRALVKTGPTPAFFAEMVLRVNFVGIGRFALSLVSEGRMEHKKSRARDERIRLMAETTSLLQAKVFYKEEGMWVMAENAQEAVCELERSCEAASSIIMDNYKGISTSIRNISEYIQGIEKHNPDLLDDISLITKY